LKLDTQRWSITNKFAINRWPGINPGLKMLASTM